jgi:hypothetical protein
MNITSQFNDCIKSSIQAQTMTGATVTAKPSKTRKTINIDDINDDFTKEAYRIVRVYARGED